MPIADKTIRIKWVRSGIGFERSQSEIVRSLGLRRLNHVVERPDTPQVRGLVAKVAHLVEVVNDVSEPVWASTPEYVIKVAGFEQGPASALSSQSEVETAAADSGPGSAGVSPASTGTCSPILAGETPALPGQAPQEALSSQNEEHTLDKGTPEKI